jgi:hypothetical protein
VEQPEWMSAQLREEIGGLRRRFGLQEEEAIAFWHLRQASSLMLEMRRVDVLKEMDEEEEERGELESGSQLAELILDISVGESRVFQHFSALYRELGARVLRRSYPEGWGAGPIRQDD